jgi:hypothetical protein
MDANLWNQIKEIYDRALDLCGDKRESYLLSACVDADLRREVESLLTAHDHASRRSRSHEHDTGSWRHERRNLISVRYIARQDKSGDQGSGLFSFYPSDNQ